jgi:small GTP-binding protein
MNGVRRFKVIVLGKSGVGKTSLLTRKYSNQFTTIMRSTVAFISYSIFVEVNGTKLEMVCWDTAGEERYESISKLYYLSAEVALIVFDTTDFFSFQAVLKYIELVKEYSHPDCLLMLIGTKQDLEDNRQVPTTSGIFLARQHKMLYIETSSKSNFNIDEAFNLLGDSLIQNSISENHHQSISNTIVLNSPSHSRKSVKKKNCCKSGH